MKTRKPATSQPTERETDSPDALHDRPNPGDPGPPVPPPEPRTDPLRDPKLPLDEPPPRGGA